MPPPLREALQFIVAPRVTVAKAGEKAPASLHSQVT